MEKITKMAETDDCDDTELSDLTRALVKCDISSVKSKSVHTALERFPELLMNYFEGKSPVEVAKFLSFSDSLAGLSREQLYQRLLSEFGSHV